MHVIIVLSIIISDHNCPLETNSCSEAPSKKCQAKNSIDKVIDFVKKFCYDKEGIFPERNFCDKEWTDEKMRVVADVVVIPWNCDEKFVFPNF